LAGDLLPKPIMALVARGSGGPPIRQCRWCWIRVPLTASPGLHAEIVGAGPGAQSHRFTQGKRPQSPAEPRGAIHAFHTGPPKNPHRRTACGLLGPPRADVRTPPLSKKNHLRHHQTPCGAATRGGPGRRTTGKPLKGTSRRGPDSFRGRPMMSVPEVPPWARVI
jgi:hypothetical protein